MRLCSQSLDVVSRQKTKRFVFDCKQEKTRQNRDRHDITQILQSVISNCETQVTFQGEIMLTFPKENDAKLHGVSGYRTQFSLDYQSDC